MNFYFCETCGKRVTEKDIAQGGGRDKKLNGVFCTDCAGGVNTLDSVPLSDDDARQLVADAAAEPVRPASIPSLKPLSGSKLSKPVILARPTVERGRPASSAALQKPSQQPLIFGAIGAGVVILAIALLATGKKEPERERVAANEEKKVQEAPHKTPPLERGLESAPVPVPSSTPAVVPTTKAFPSGLLAEPDRNEPTPKELYDRSVREGRIKPDAPAPAPAAGAPAEKPVDTKGADLLSIATPPADDPSWKPLFNGKDLTGWNSGKGSWKFENGMAFCMPAPENGARLDGTTSFSDFEVTGQLFVEQRTYMDFRVHETRTCDFQIKEVNQWHTIRMVTIGNAVQGTLDGKPLNPRGESGASGGIRIFVEKGCSVKIKDLRLRTLTEKDLPKP